MLPRNRPPTHPGEILAEEFLGPLRITQKDCARRLRVPVQRINTLVKGKRGVTPETAWLLSSAFGTTAEFWMNLQTNWDLYHARKRLGRLPAPRHGRARPSTTRSAAR